jgi:predicted nucleotidyltransferase
MELNNIEKMQYIQNKLPQKQLHFFEMLRDYLQIPLYFFGSVQRMDYFQGYSDIDLCIFTDNTQATISQIQYYLAIPAYKIKKFVWVINQTTIKGYKIMYKIKEEKFFCEMSIYAKHNREQVLQEHYKKLNIPLYACYLLLILKYFHYYWNILDRVFYKRLKKWVLSYAIGLRDDLFFLQ